MSRTLPLPRSWRKFEDLDVVKGLFVMLMFLSSHTIFRSLSPGIQVVPLYQRS